MANTIEWFKRFLIAGVIIGVLFFILTKDPITSFWFSILIVGFATAYAFFTRCTNCDNCFTVWEIDKRLIDTNLTRIPYTKQVPVGQSVRRYHYVDGGSRVTHTETYYEEREFLKEITRKKYEHTHKCNHCGNISHSYSTSESSQTFSR